MSGRIGIDTGGTFTDFVLLDGSGTLRTAKVPSTPDDPSLRDPPRARAARRERVRRPGGRGYDGGDERRHPAARADRPLRDERGVRGRAVHRPPRQGAALRPPLAQAEAARPAPRLPVGVAGRVDHDGEIVEDLEPAGLEQLREELRPLAGDGRGRRRVVPLLVPQPGARAGDRRRDPGGRCPTLPISVSHEVSPVWREYERASTTIADAFVKPLIEVYVDRVGAVIREDTGIERWNLLASNGGYLRAEQARRGPGRAAPLGARRRRHRRPLLRRRPRAARPSFSLDMGGTSCDIGLVLDGRGAVRERVPGRVGHPGQHPLRRRQHDRRGRRLDRLDRQGRPAPRRAAERGRRAGPGRVRHGRHRADPDRRQPDARPARPGVLPRRRDAARRGRGPRRPRRARRRARPARGGRGPRRDPHRRREHGERDPADRGRARPRPARLRPDRVRRAPGRCTPARSPSASTCRPCWCRRTPGLCSAFGAAITRGAGRSRADVVRALRPRATSTTSRAPSGTLRDEAVAELRRNVDAEEVEVRRSADLRYAGQNYELEVALPDGDLDDDRWQELLARFEDEHERQYGFRLPGEAIELINLRVTALRPRAARIARGRGRRRRPSPRRAEVWFDADGPVDCPILRRGDLAPGAELDGPGDRRGARLDDARLRRATPSEVDRERRARPHDRRRRDDERRSSSTASACTCCTTRSRTSRPRWRS